MQEHSVPVAHLVFPVLLPFRQRIFLQETVCTDDEHRSGSLETYTTLNADDSVAHVAVTPDAVSSTNLFHCLNGGNLVIVVLAVHRAKLTLLEAQFQEFWTFLCGVLQVS